MSSETQPEAAPADRTEVAIHLPKNMIDPKTHLQPVTSHNDGDTSGQSQLDSVDDGPEETAVYTSHLTPLETSLLYCLEDPTTTTPELIQDIAEDNNPRRVQSEKDNAAYWVKDDGSPLLLSFPAILDTQGKYGRTGPYFNMMENTDENNFRRTKAVFELRLPKDSDTHFPSEAQEVSKTFWMLLAVLRNEVEDKRNLGLNKNHMAAVTEFWKEQGILVVSSDPLFGGMGDPSKIETPKISRSQLSSREGMLSVLNSPGSSTTSTPLSSPSKAGPPGRSNIYMLSADAPVPLQKMPDPHGRYANLMARHPHLKTTVTIPPDIRDQNGVVILPSDYSDKLGRKTPVFVTVKLRLWEIKPTSEEKRATSAYKTREGEENGTRIYQLVLHKMSLLPSSIPSRNVVPLKYRDFPANKDSDQAPESVDPGKGKKRASEDSQDGHGDVDRRTKRARTEDGDVQMYDAD